MKMQIDLRKVIYPQRRRHCFRIRENHKISSFLKNDFNSQKTHSTFLISENYDYKLMLMEH